MTADPRRVSPPKPLLKAFRVTIPGYTGGSIVEAETASKARYLAWIRINDVVPVRLIDLHVHRAPLRDEAADHA